MNTPDTTESRWATTVVLGDGSTAFIRPLVPDDQEALLAFHMAQSRDSVYRRFFSPKPTLSTSELAHFTTVDMVDRVALAVEVHDEFVGWCSYERLPGRDEAEAAFMVDDRYHGLGIATLMLEHLAAIARVNGIARFAAEVLSDNRGMLAVFAKAGWPLQRRFDSGVVDLDWELTATEEFIDTVERREQRADSRAVARILLPRAIAVIGASDREGSAGNVLWHNVRSKANVPVYPVNPRLEDLDGVRCYGSVGDLPPEASLAIIAVPPGSLESTIDACIEKRMRGAVVVTSPDGDEFDVPTVVARARRHGLRLIGPSSLGVASLHPDSALQAGLIDVTLPAGGVAISMQSGSLGASLLRRARDLNMGLSWFVSLGDKSDVSANDLLQFWEHDQFTRVIGLYTESFGNPRKFARISRRVSRTKPIVAVRTGAAADGLGSALYQQAGLIEVPTVHA
ncbi:GNAT family N-acetyltransferase, partial [Ilumatobacter sp.]|uniref:GNAT family N-acetyltransferase n=1 Tax=Ilumatobacter sp. TaxID=1967498 RepID=UPI003C68B3D0